MKKRGITNSILAVLSGVLISLTAQATPHAPSPNLSVTKEVSAPPTEEEIERARSVNVSVPPASRRHGGAEADSFFFRYRKALAFRAGSNWSLSDLAHPGPVFGFMYWSPSESLTEDFRGIETGADLNRDGTGTLHITYRGIEGRERFRWFYKIGGGIRIVPADQLVTFVRPRNWQARAGTGVEQTLWDGKSLRFDLESILSTEKSELLATLGLSFGW